MTITMQSRALSVEGGFEFQARVFGDDRGIFVSPYQEAAFVAATGHKLFPVAQTNHSRSRRGVVRGLHYTVTPPGMAKYVYCARGRTLDIVLDIRVGSPTFGQWDSALLDQEAFRSVYLPVGMAHGFIALEDDTVVSYMLSGEYVQENEAALSVLDPTLGLPLPTDVAPILSERDQAAPTLAEALAAGLLPDYQTCLKLDRALRSA
ncbi:dTDP-4-dehydrorhamnose 3,5-epimerase family protein [Streptomyces sp. NBC_00690]|uniref:dTDP-4-dehydrorhamnose 3,5-epimerase family protein n=1 Tax=Streptomyces sp. NBC_00690 TaxID=2975808 RepID=UPI002E2AB8BD|nr:dTDP-4-dehydrorhamnose 3,5-epimerase [Streptomyces sp. NBC_00690]